MNCGCYFFHIIHTLTCRRTQEEELGGGGENELVDGIYQLAKTDSQALH